MSTTIDEKVVSMKFDNAKFEENANQSMSTLDRLKNALKFEGASKGLESISAAASNIKMDGVSTACETASSKFSALEVVAITALANIANDAINAGKKVVNALTLEGALDGFKEYELKMGSVQTIMAGTGETLQVVMKYLEELNLYADKTIYSFADMTANIGKFTNAGVKLDDAVAAIKGIANEAALSGANAEQASHAMYNFAQALSAGYVKLVDWKSIEVANMATLEFKQTLLDTAVSLGTVVKEGDKYRTVTENAKGKVSDLFTATENFNDSLNHQWMTTEVLTKTLALYADENTEIGKKATDAATKVKTFSMMMDTLKEAVGSGWAVTWEKIIGDFNQATDFFTEITDKLSSVIDASAKSRNEFLDQALNKSGIYDRDKWREVASTITSAGGSLTQFQNVLIGVAKRHGVEIDKMIEEEGNFSNTLESGWLTGEMFREATTEIERLGATAPTFKDLANAVSVANEPFTELKKEITEVSGRTHLLNAISNVFKAIEKAVVPVKEAFREIFPAKTGDELRDALGLFEKFTRTLILSDEEAGKVKETFKGFFNVIKQGITVVKSILDAFSPLKDIFVILAKNLLDGVSAIGKFFNTLDAGADTTSAFQKTLSYIHDLLETFANNLQSYIDSIKDGWGKLRGLISEKFETMHLTKVSDAVDKIKEALSGFTKGLSQGFVDFLNVLGRGVKPDGINKILDVLSKFAEKLKPVGEAIKNFIVPITTKLKEFITNIDIIDSMCLAFKAGGFAAITAVIGNFVDGIKDFFDQVDSVKNPISALAGIVQQLTDLFGSIEEAVRVSVVKDFAISIGILAAAMYALASIDAEAARRSVAIITLLTAELVGVFQALKKLNKSTAVDGSILDRLKNVFSGFSEAANLAKAAGALISFAAAVGILAGALKIISTIPQEEILASLGAVSLMIAELTGVAALLGKVGGNMTKGVGSMIAMAAAVVILAEAIKMIADIDTDSLCDGLIAVTVLLGELTAMMLTLDIAETQSKAGAMIAMASAVVILAGALKIFETMNLASIGKGLGTVAALLVELGLAFKFIKGNVGEAASLLIAATALTVLGGALKIFASIKPEAIIPSLLELGAALGILVIALNAMNGALPGAGALIVASSAVAILAGSLMALSVVNPERLIVTIGELVLALVALGGVSALLSPLAPEILAFAAALLVLSAAIAGIGIGVLAAGAGLTAMATAFGMLAEISKESAERIVEALQIILSGLIRLIPDMVSSFTEGILQMCDLLVQGAPRIGAALNALVQLMIQVLTENIPAMAEAFAKLMLSLIETTATYTPQIVDQILKMVTSMLKVFKDNLPSLIQSGVDLMVAFINGVQSAQNQLIDAAMQAMIAFINGLADSINKNTPLLVNAINRLFDAVITAALTVLSGGNPKFVQEAKKLMTSFKTGIQDMQVAVVKALRTIIDSLINAAREGINGFKEAASYLIDGFIQGIKDKLEAAKEAVKDFAGNIVDALKGALNIHSPSRIARGLGNFFGEGFVLGVNDKDRDASLAGTNMANSLIEAIKKIIDEGVDVDPTITPILDLSNIKAGSKELSDLTSSFDDVSVGVSGNLASSISSSMNASLAERAESQNGLEMLRTSLESLSNIGGGNTIQNTFNITGDNPKEIANEVSRILQQQVERRGAAWA